MNTISISKCHHICFVKCELVIFCIDWKCKKCSETGQVHPWALPYLTLAIGSDFHCTTSFIYWTKKLTEFARDSNILPLGRVNKWWNHFLLRFKKHHVFKCEIYMYRSAQIWGFGFVQLISELIICCVGTVLPSRFFWIQ